MSWLALTLRSKRDYVAIVVLLTLSNIFLLFTRPFFLRLLGGVTLFCFLPGFLLINLLFPKSGSFSLLERLLLSAEASYVLSTSCVLAVHFVPGEITLTSICIALDGLVSTLLALNVLLRKAAAGRLDNRWPSKTVLLQIVLLVALAAFFRFAYLGYSEYQGDEVTVVSVAREAIVGRDDALFLHRKGPTEASMAIAFTLFTDGFIEKWLEAHAQRVTERWFGNVRLALYSAPGKAEEDIRYLQEVNFEAKVELVMSLGRHRSSRGRRSI